MKRFSFQLEPLLEARRRAERDRQIRVAAIERERRELEERLREHQTQMEQSRSDLRGGLVGELQTSQLRWGAGAAMGIQRRARRAMLELAAVHRRLDAARGELIEAARQRRAIELLREKRLAAWKADMNKAQDAAIDELAVMSAARPRFEVMP